MGTMGCTSAWRSRVVLAVLLVFCVALPASAATPPTSTELALKGTSYQPLNGRTTYFYELRVTSPNDLQAESSTLKLSGMSGILSQGNANYWRNTGITPETANWLYVTQAPFTLYGTFDVITTGTDTEPGPVNYCLDGPTGKCGTVIGPVPKDAPPAYCIGGTVYVDNDGSGGLYDGGTDDTGLAGVEVQLLDAGGNVIATTTTSGPITDENNAYVGNYRFGDLLPGDYTVVVPASVSTAGGDLFPTTVIQRSVTIVDAPVRQIDFGYGQLMYSQPVSVDVLAYVFFDFNKNGQMDDFELAFDGIAVSLTGAADQTEITGSGGLADFGAQDKGDYSMAVTDGGTYGLLDYWVTTTPESYDFTIDADTESPVIRYFGYYPDVPKITEAFSSREITGTNHTIGFWKHNVTRAIMGSNKGIQVTRDELLGYLADVEGFGPCDDPYQFGDEPLQKALWYLTPALSGNSPVGKLERQLLAAELNLASGLGSSMPDLESAIYWYAEWVANYDQDNAGALASFIDQWNNLGNMSGDGLDSSEDTTRVPVDGKKDKPKKGKKGKQGKGGNNNRRR